MFLDDEVETVTKISFSLGDDGRAEWATSYSSYACYGFVMIAFFFGVYGSVVFAVLGLTLWFGCGIV